MSKNKTQTTKWKEKRRFHSVKLKRKGWTQREIATALDVSEGAVSRWLTTARVKGKRELRSRPHTGQTIKTDGRGETIASRFSFTRSRNIWFSR